MTIYVHIGTHKTGSTTIQRALRETSKLGVQEGWEYLGKPTKVKELMKAQNYKEELVRIFSQWINNSIKRSGQSSKKIISSEALIGNPSIGYMNSRVVATMLCDALKHYDVKIIVYLRRQDEIIESLYTQKIHEGNSLKFEEFISQFEPGREFNYSQMLQDWMSCFGKSNVIVRSYDNAIQYGLLKDFGEIIGSTKILNASKKHENPSYSCEALNVALHANQILDETSKKQLRKALQKTMSKKQLGSYSYFSDEERKNFLDKYRHSNQKVADLFFDGVPEDLFPKPKPVANNDNSGLNRDCVSYNKVAQLVAELLSSNSSNYTNSSKSSVGIVAGARVAISGYPKLRKFLRRVRRLPIIRKLF